MRRPIPTTDRNPQGYLRWPIWAPFWALGWLLGNLTHWLPTGSPLRILIFALLATGAPWDLALWATRRTPLTRPETTR